MSIEKYKGIFPAFYACYGDDGNISKERTAALVEFFVEKGMNGLYVGGSSGECIYQSVEDSGRGSFRFFISGRRDLKG